MGTKNRIKTNLIPSSEPFKIFLILVLILCLKGKHSSLTAQDFIVSGEFRPETQYNNYMVYPGYDPIFLISQRTRLKFDYANTLKNYKARLTIQDISIWGSSDQLTTVGNNSLMTHEAWIELLLKNDLSLKIGRQVICYDDERILSENDGLQQARSHDIGILKYEGDFHFHLGAAYNNNTDPLQSFKLPYTLNNYKTMQYAHFNKEMSRFDISLLTMNSGLELSPDTMVYNQTFGFNTNAMLNDFLSATGLFYYQTGKDHMYRDLSAYNTKVTLCYAPVPDKLFLTLGYNRLSGNDRNTPANENHSFSLFYGAPLGNLGLTSQYYLGPPIGISSYNFGITNTTFEILFNTEKMVLSHCLILLNSINTISSSIDEADGKYLGIENSFRVDYQINEQVMFCLQVYIFNMSNNFKIANPYFDYSTLEGTQQSIVLNCTVLPVFFKFKRRNDVK